MHQFSEDNVVKGSWWTYPNIGDKIQGTYVGKSSKPSKYQQGEMQQIYELMTEDGQIWYIGGKQSIDLQMKHIDFGQIIEFKYVEELDTGKGNSFKNVKIYQDKNVINKDWLMQNEGNMAEAELQGEMTAEQVAAEYGGKVIEETSQATDLKLAEIYDAGVAKGLFPLELPVSEKDKIIMKTTKLGLIEENYDAILEKLK